MLSMLLFIHEAPIYSMPSTVFQLSLTALQTSQKYPGPLTRKKISLVKNFMGRHCGTEALPVRTNLLYHNVLLCSHPSCNLLIKHHYKLLLSHKINFLKFWFYYLATEQTPHSHSLGPREPLKSAACLFLAVSNSYFHIKVERHNYEQLCRSLQNFSLKNQREWVLWFCPHESEEERLCWI